MSWFLILDNRMAVADITAVFWTVPLSVWISSWDSQLILHRLRQVGVLRDSWLVKLSNQSNPQIYSVDQKQVLMIFVSCFGKNSNGLSQKTSKSQGSQQIVKKISSTKMILEMIFVSVVCSQNLVPPEVCKAALGCSCWSPKKGSVEARAGHFFGWVGLLAFETHPCFNTSTLRPEFSCHGSGSKICLLGATWEVKTCKTF